MTVADYISRAGILADDYERIYFTGEGAIRQTADEDVCDCFLQMRDLNGDGYDFVSVVPEFMTD